MAREILDPNMEKLIKDERLKVIDAFGEFIKLSIDNDDIDVNKLVSDLDINKLVSDFKRVDNLIRDQQRQFEVMITKYANVHGISFSEARKKRHLENKANYSIARMNTRQALTETHGYYNSQWEDVL